MDPLKQAQEKLSAIMKNLAEVKPEAPPPNLAEMTAEAEKLQGAIAQMKAEDLENRRLALLEASAKAAAAPEPQRPARTVTGGDLAVRNAKTWGFRDVADQLNSVKNQVLYSRHDPRLVPSNTISTYAGEGTGADGGFALAPQFSQEIWQAVKPAESFLSALTIGQTQGSMITLPTDQDPPWSLATGMYAAKRSEAGALTAVKPTLGQTKVTMYTASGLVYASWEALQDIPFLGSYIQARMAEKLRALLEYWFVQGDGQNMPEGIINAKCQLVVSDVGSSTTAPVFGDVANMVASKLPGAAFWLCHPTVLPYIWGLNSAYPNAFMSNLNGSPGGTLFGYPVYSSEMCPTYNSQGDFNLVVPSGIATFTGGAPQSDTSIHIGFEQGLNAFRIMARAGQAMLLSSKVTRHDAATYASHIVTLAGSRS